MHLSICLFMPKGLQANCQSVQFAVLKVFVFFEEISGCSVPDRWCPVLNKKILKRGASGFLTN